MAKRGRPPRVTEAERAVLIEIVREDPTATLGEIQIAWEQRSGLKAHPQTLQKALRAAGIEKRLKSPVVRVEASAPGQPRYGYTEAHRRQTPEQTYPSFLTDAEWALVEDLFDNARGRGAPPDYPRRLLVEACAYVVRTGSAWRLLPRDFPAWQNVYRTFRRWSAQGKFEQMHDRLRAQWREREGRA